MSVDGGPLPPGITWKEGPRVLLPGCVGPESGTPACHTEAPQDEGAGGTHTDHKCSDVGPEV